MSTTATTPPVIASSAQAHAAAARLATEIRVGVVERDANRAVPYGPLRALRESGLLGITVPPEYGGAGADRGTVTEIFRLIATADPAVAQIPQAHFGVIEALKASGTEDQRRRFFAAALAGERFANAIAERGTERADIRKARLQQAGDGFLLNGTKYYSTGALTADWVAVLAADPDDNQAFVLVPAGSPGLERHDDWRGFGQRSSTSGTTVLKDVRVSAEQVLPRPAPDAALNLIGPGTQLVHAAIDTGIARGALDDGTAFIRDRARPWREANVARAAEEPHVIVHVGKLATRVTAAEALLGWAADTLDQIRAEPLTEASVTRAVLAVDQTKAFAAEVSLQVASEILELAGSSATDAGHGLDRHWRNARTHTLHDPARWKFHHVGAWLLSGEQPPFAPA